MVLLIVAVVATRSMWRMKTMMSATSARWQPVRRWPSFRVDTARSVKHVSTFYWQTAAAVRSAGAKYQ